VSDWVSRGDPSSIPGAEERCSSSMEWMVVGFFGSQRGALVGMELVHSNHGLITYTSISGIRDFTTSHVVVIPVDSCTTGNV
jgi:hypothetical protein